MNTFAEIAQNIIKEQQLIIGPIALEQAKKIAGLEITGETNIKITGSGKKVLEDLVNEYAKLFGQASVEVCKEAFSPFAGKIPESDVPDVLKS